MYAPKLRTWVSDRERRHAAIDFAASEIMADISKEFAAIRKNDDVVEECSELSRYLSRFHYSPLSLQACGQMQSPWPWMYGIGGAAIVGESWL